MMRRKEKCLARRRKSKKTNHDAAQSLMDGDNREDLSELKLFGAYESENVTVGSHHARGRYIQVCT